MQFEKHQSLEKLTQKLVQTDGLMASEIEKIVNSPELYLQIRARIEAKQTALASAKRATAGEFIIGLVNNWKRLPHLTFATTALSVAFVCAIVLIVWHQSAFDSNKNALLPKNIVPNQTNDFSNKSDQSLLADTRSATIALMPENEKLAADNALDKTAKIAKSNFVRSQRTKNAALLNNNLPVAQTKFIKPKEDVVLPPQPSASPAREFYPLAFANNLETTESKQIVRVELTPVALASLGVVAPNYAMQNSETKSITADLLLGEDGTPRAIRFVN